MSRQSEYKKKFDPEMGKYTRQHIWGDASPQNPPAYGSGIWGDTLKSVGKKLFGKTVKSAAKKGVEKGLTTAATKTGDYVGKKAGDKIVQILSKDSKPKKSTPKKVTNNVKKTQKEIDQMLNNLLSGGSTRKKKII